MSSMHRKRGCNGDGSGIDGGILVVCIGRFRKFFKANGFALFQNNKGEIRWQQARSKTLSTGKGISQ